MVKIREIVTRARVAPRRRVKRVKQVVVMKNKTRKRRMNMRSRIPMSLSPFESCVFGTVSSVDMTMGVPDGDNSMAFTYDFHGRYTIKPQGGAICFALHPSPLGALAIDQGSVTADVYTADQISGVITGTSAQAFTFPTPGSGQYSLLPFNEWLGAPAGGVISTGVTNQSALRAQKFRVINNSGLVTFTGGTNTDQGSYVTARSPLSVDEIVFRGLANPVKGNQIQVLSGSQLPRTESAIAGLTGAQSGAAKMLTCGRDLINPPFNFDYQPWLEGSQPTLAAADGSIAAQFAQLFQGSIVSPTGYSTTTPGIGNAQTTYFRLDGLDATSSIIVQTKTCVQFVPQFNSPMERMSAPSPPKNTPVLDRTQNIARQLPVSKPSSEGIGGIGGAVSWYGETMKNIYQGITGKFSQMFLGGNIWEGGSNAAAITAGAAGRAYRGRKVRGSQQLARYYDPEGGYFVDEA